MHKSMILRSICILKRTSTMDSLCWFAIHNGIVTHVIFEATTSIAHVITPLTTLAETIVPVGNDELFHGSHPYRYLVRRACFALSSVSVSASTKARACFAFFHASCASCSVANLPRCWLVFPSQNCAIHDSFLYRLRAAPGSFPARLGRQPCFELGIRIPFLADGHVGILLQVKATVHIAPSCGGWVNIVATIVAWYIKYFLDI